MIWTTLLFHRSGQWLRISCRKATMSNHLWSARRSKELSKVWIECIGWEETYRPTVLAKLTDQLGITQGKFLPLMMLTDKEIFINGYNKPILEFIICSTRDQLDWFKIKLSGQEFLKDQPTEIKKLLRNSQMQGSIWVQFLMFNLEQDKGDRDYNLKTSHQKFLQAWEGDKLQHFYRGDMIYGWIETSGTKGVLLVSSTLASLMR